MDPELHIRPMTRSEVDQLVGWAASEGWNPGLHDAEIFWHTDPHAFVAAELRGELVGGGAISSYDGAFGFMGFFIMRPPHRGVGLGNQLWHARRDRLLARLNPGASIGMDGVFTMQPYYARGGFVFAHRDLRFGIPSAAALTPTVGVADDRTPAQIVPLATVPFETVLQYDRQCFPAPRARFLDAWIGQADALALGARRGDALGGYGVVRRCAEGCKVGPLFADDPATAGALLAALSRFAGDGPLFLDTPESNPAAVALARQAGMAEVFGCARMYLGGQPVVAGDKVYGVTTFELG